LFNLRHASARNVVERIFGSLKKRFNILTHPAQYDMDIQARIPPATAAMHNFILDHDPEELDKVSEAPDPNPGNLPAERDFGTLVVHQMLQRSSCKGKTRPNCAGNVGQLSGSFS